MNNVRSLLFVVILLLVLIGCGGGGSTTSTSNDSQTITVTIPANTETKKTIGRASITFTFSQETQVTLSSYSQWKLPNQFAQRITDSLAISATNKPTKDVIISFPLNQPLSDDLMVLAVAKTNDPDRPWDSIPFEKTNQSLTVRIRPEQINQTRDISNTLTNLVGFVFFKPSPSADPAQMSLVKVAGNGPLGEHSLILVHGLANNWRDMNSLGKALVKAGIYQNAYSLSYDWRLPGEPVAAFLRDQLAKLPPKSIDLLGHSFGGTIVRYALEPLKATKAVRNAVFVCSPLRGDLEANFGDLIADLLHWQLNTPYTESEFHGLASLNTPSAQSLNSTSDYMRTMAAPLGDQRGNVNYLLIGGLTDTFVGWHNAEMIGINLENFTEGKVERLTENVGHSNLIRQADGIATLVEDIRNFIAPKLDGQMLSFYPSDQVNESHNFFLNQDGWVWTLTIYNADIVPINIDSLSLDKYDAQGSWIGVWWYDPSLSSGQTFPTQATSWKVSIQPKQQITTPQIHTIVDIDDPFKPIDQASQNLQAQTVVCTVQWHDVNGAHSTHASIVNYYNSLWPSIAQTRSSHRSSSSRNGFSLIRQ